MRFTKPLIIAGAQAQAAAALDQPYAGIVSRNMFGLLPISTNNPVVEPTIDPPPKITPNGTMTLFGKLEALFKVASKGQPGQPAKDDSYVLGEGERQDDIEVVKINQADGIVTFNNHGTIQELPLVAAVNNSAPAAAGGPGSRQSPEPQRERLGPVGEIPRARKQEREKGRREADRSCGRMA